MMKSLVAKQNQAAAKTYNFNMFSFVRPYAPSLDCYWDNSVITEEHRGLEQTLERRLLRC